MLIHSFSDYLGYISEALLAAIGWFNEITISPGMLGVAGAIFGVFIFSLAVRYLVMPLIASSINRTASDAVDYQRKMRSSRGKNVSKNNGYGSYDVD